MEIRNYTEDDLADLARLGNKLDMYGQVETEEDVRTVLSLPKSEPGKDIFMVTDGVVLSDTRW